jgi:hypothetical protein
MCYYASPTRLFFLSDYLTYYPAVDVTVIQASPNQFIEMVTTLVVLGADAKVVLQVPLILT